MQQAPLMIDGSPKRKRKYACVLVKDVKSHCRWYRLSPKVARAVWLHCKKKDNTSAFKILKGLYINIPLTRYSLHNTAGIGVGKIVGFSYRWVPVNTLCTRSQFIQPERLANITDAFHYLKHDYGLYSHWQIFVDLYLWRLQSRS